jgi:hypothetical protein
VELIISKLAYHFEGLKIVLKNDDNIQTLSIINGNQSDFLGPVILFNLDQHIIYGMSHPEVISRIYTKGPQQLITTKDLSHNLFEHGMKASLGKVKIKLNWFLTTLETFYTVTSSTPILQLVLGKDNRIGCLITPVTIYQSVLLCNYGFEIKDPEKYMISDIVEIDAIQSYVSVILKPNVLRF